VQARRIRVGGTDLRLELVRGWEEAVSATRRTIRRARSGHLGAEDQSRRRCGRDAVRLEPGRVVGSGRLGLGWGRAGGIVLLYGAWHGVGFGGAHRFVGSLGHAVLG
jgi:hypothetical protein